MEEPRRQSPPLALQLVHENENRELQLDEAVVQRCFLEGDVSNYLACLICVIGERRRGKSTVLNYILRALGCLERREEVSLGQENEPLTGFQWRNGADTVTRGIWIWSKPFILERNSEKMAVFVLDTEGSLDISNNREACLKMSALSMLLSSYLTFNVNGYMNETEVDYLELYIHVSEETRRSSSLQNFQHLDFLVRDWQEPDNCGRDAARAYLEQESQKLRRQQSTKYEHLLKTLSSPSVRAFLLPHPGNRFLRLRQGSLADMEDGFREHLTTYVSILVEESWHHQKTNTNGQKVTCGLVGNALKELVTMLQSIPCSFDSPLQMRFSIENQKLKNEVLKSFQDFLEGQIFDNFLIDRIVRPPQMNTRISNKVRAVLEKYCGDLKGDNAEEKRRLREEMTDLLIRRQEGFCTKYSQRYNAYEMKMSIHNQRVKERELRLFQDFLDGEKSINPFKVLRNAPSEIKAKVNDKVRDVLETLDNNLQGDGEEKERLMFEISSLLETQQNRFCTKYSRRYTACVVGASVGGALCLTGGIAGGIAVGIVLSVEAAIITGTVTGTVGLTALGMAIKNNKFCRKVRSGITKLFGRRTEDTQLLLNKLD